MKIAIVGTGNIAFQLGRRLSLQGIDIRFVIGRNALEGNKLASEIGCLFSADFDASELDCDVFLVAVSDMAISEVALALKRKNATILHTSGSVKMEVLPGNSIGVLWPLYSITQSRELQWKEIPLITESSDKKAKKHLSEICVALGGEQYFLNSQQRAHAHLMAVFTNNFTNHFFHLIEKHQSVMKLDKKMFNSILKDTFNSVLASDNKENKLLDKQTGPAIRKDKLSMESHKELLADNPQLKKLYENFSSSIHQTYYGEEL